MNSPISAREVKRHKWWGWGLDDITFRFPWLRKVEDRHGP